MKARSIVECGTHGNRVASVVCRHIVEAKDKIVGFVENSSDPNDLQAWCDDCEQLFLKEGSRTDEFRAFTGMRIVCDFCYATLKDRHAEPAE